MCVLYPEDEKQLDTLNYIEQEFKDYAYILHDKDFNEVGELKKEHIHIMVKVKEPITLSAFSKKIDLAENYITPTKGSYINGLRYLVHADDEDKFQYSIKEVKGPLKKNLQKSLDSDKTEAEYVIDICDLIDNYDYIDLGSFVRILANSGLWSTYRRSQYTFNQLISNHNLEYLKQNKNLT